MARSRQLAALHTRRPSTLVKPQVINLGQSCPVAGHPMYAQCHRLSFGNVCVESGARSVSIGGKQRPPAGARSMTRGTSVYLDLT